MYKSFLFLIIMLLLGCEKNPKKTIFCGKIFNPKDSLIVLYSNDKIVDSVRLTKDATFCFELKDLKQEGLFYVKMGNFFKHIYIAPQDSLMFVANMFNFHKSAMFSGRGAEVNNFITKIQEDVVNQQDVYKTFFKYPAEIFTQKADSIYENHQKNYNIFITQNPNLSEKAKKITWASFFFDAHKPYEQFLFHYNYSRSKEEKLTTLPTTFYDYRKQIDFNDLELSYYPPYHQFLIHHINNISYAKNMKYKYLDSSERMLQFQINRLETSDSIFKNQTIKDNMIRSVAFSYLLHPKMEDNGCVYVEHLHKYIQNSVYKPEIEELYKSIIHFKVGTDMPNLRLTDISSQKVLLQGNIVKQKVNVLYFWSAENKYQFLHPYLSFLQKKFPHINFIGIDISQNFRQWAYEVSDTQVIATQQFFIDAFGNSQEEKFITHSLNKALIINKKGKIAKIFVDIHNDLEEVLTEF